jgi:hypothetical protein
MALPGHSAPAWRKAPTGTRSSVKGRFPVRASAGSCLYLDAGTGDSDFTWQAMAGVGYQFDWGATVLSWRHLDYEMESDATIENFAFSGVLLGVTFRW